MLFKTEDGAARVGLVGTNAFEDAHAVMQGMSEHVDLGVAPGHELTIHPDPAVAIRH